MSHGSYEISVICEEAHRYVPHDHARGFGPTRQAIARIAKEGRKFGASIGVISQRPSELDPTILSQCSTLFAMRLANEHDKAIIRSAIAQGSESRIGFLSSIRNRECIAFGEAIATPMRMFFSTVQRSAIPVSQSHEHAEEVDANQAFDLKQVVQRMRGQEEGQRILEDLPAAPSPPANPNVLSGQAPLGRSEAPSLRNPANTKYLPQW